VPDPVFRQRRFAAQDGLGLYFRDCADSASVAPPATSTSWPGGLPARPAYCARTGHAPGPTEPECVEALEAFLRDL